MVVVWVLVSTGVIPHFWNHPDAAPVLHPLAQIPSGVEVYADDAALAQVSEGKPLAQIAVSGSATGNRWTLVKLGGHVYLRGHIASTTATSLSSLQGKPLNVYNDDDSGELEHVSSSNVTLRLDKVPVQKSGGDGDYSEVTVPNFQPDPLTTLDAGR